MAARLADRSSSARIPVSARPRGRLVEEVHAAHARLRGERHELGVRLGDLAAAQVELLLGQHDDGAAFGRFVGERGELRGVGQALRRARPARG